MATDAELDLDDVVVQSIYKAAAGLVAWDEPLAGLFRQFGLRSMQLVFVDNRTGALLGSEQPAQLFDQDAIHGTLEHIREWARIDPHVATVARLPVGTVYDSERDGAAKAYAETPFYRDFWSAFGNRGLLAAKVAQTEEHSALLGMIRSHWHAPFSPAEGRLFERYCGHLRAALQVSRYVESLRTDAIAGRALLEASAHPMLLFDGDLRMKDLNPPAQALLADGSAFFLSQDFLACRSATDTEVLRNAVSRLLTPEARSDRTAFRLHGSKREATLCTLWYLKPETTMAAFGKRPVLLMSIVGRGKESRPDPSFLEALFTLTPAESRVAIELQTGMPLARIARHRNVSLDTIKSQVRSIYAKVDVRNRAQLVQRLVEVSRP
jgi:DNA-binding CsgD family transcriptional regulator